MPWIGQPRRIACPRSIVLAFTSSPQVARPPFLTKSLWFPRHLPFAETRTVFVSWFYVLATRRGNSSHWTGRLGSWGRSLTMTVNSHFSCETLFLDFHVTISLPTNQKMKIVCFEQRRAALTWIWSAAHHPSMKVLGPHSRKHPYQPHQRIPRIRNPVGMEWMKFCKANNRRSRKP